MAKNVRFGIIGSAGLIGNYHANVITKGEGPYQLTALCDINQERLQEQAQRLGLPGTTRAAELVGRDDVDAVITDARRMIKAINRKRRIAGIHYQARSAPAVVKVKDMIDSGELGKLLSIRLSGSYYKSDYYYSLGGWRGTWRDEGGGVLINQAPHDIDLMCYLAGGAMPAELTARWTNIYHTNSQVEDMATAAGVFPNGTEFSLHVSVALHSDGTRLEVFGSAGAVTIQGRSLTRYVRYETDLIDFARTLPELGEHDASLVHKRFAEAVLTRKKAKVLVPAAEGLWSQETINAIFLSGYLGKKVKPCGRRRPSTPSSCPAIWARRSSCRSAPSATRKCWPT